MSSNKLNRLAYKLRTLKYKKTISTKSPYSQYGQDEYVVESIYKGKRGGVFLDIGANDGITHSNSKWLEEVYGWTGVCVEPHPLAVSRFKEARSTTLEECCIGKDGEDVEFVVLHGFAEQLSGTQENCDPTVNERVATAISEGKARKEIIRVSNKSFSTIVNQHNLTNIDFISLDIEGGEMSVLESIDFGSFPIGVITIENNPRWNRFQKLLEGNGFKLSAVLGVDEVFVNPQYVAKRLEESAKR